MRLGVRVGDERRDGARVARVDADVGRVVVREEEPGLVDADAGAREERAGALGDDGAERAHRGVAVRAVEEAHGGVEELREDEVGLGGTHRDEVGRGQGGGGEEEGETHLGVGERGRAWMVGVVCEERRDGMF